MKRYLWWLTGGVVLFFLLWLYTGELPGALNLSSIIGGALILIAVIVSGSAVSGDRMRANHAYEDAQDRHARWKWTANCLTAAIPLLLIPLLHYLFAH